MVGKKKTPRGRIHVSTGTAFGKLKLAPVVPQFLARYPDITLQVDLSDRQVDLVTEQVDVAIRSGALGDSTLVARKLLDADRIICASPAYLKAHGTPKNPADLLRHNCLTLSGFTSLALWPFHTPEGNNRLAVGGNFTSDSADQLLDMAIMGLGVVRIADFMAERALKDGKLVQLLADHHLTETFPIHAVTVPGRHRAPRIKAFIEFLVEELGG